jgi:tRNA pseudouridine55 synthase
MDGIFNINKATGMTSHDVVAKIRKLLEQKRVGHAGTLDPAASGVLPICVGQGSRVAQYLSESGKAYQAKIIFGAATDTYDAEGAITHTASTTDLTLSKIEETIPHFVGPQLQAPPPYSAIKLQGQPAYKRARAGEPIALESRPIVIYALEVIDWTPPRLALAIECSKGTYIRSLAHDLGLQLGCYAYLEALLRTRSGPFLLAESITLEQLAEAGATDTVQQYLYPIDKALEQYPALIIDAETAEGVKHGNAFRTPALAGRLDIPTGRPQGIAPTIDNLARVYDAGGNFLAIAGWDEEREAWHPKKVFTASETPG